MSSQAELAVIGAVMIDTSLAIELRKRMTIDAFETAEGKAFFEYVNQGEELDPILMVSKIGHQTFFEECVKTTPTTANFEAYCDILIEQGRKRKLQLIADSINLYAFDENRKADEIITELSHQVDDLKQTKHTSVKSSAEIEEEWMLHYEKAKQDPEAGWCRSGYPFLDAGLGNGFINSGLYIIGARPGMGKTTFGLNIADRIAKTGKAILFCSLEMSSKQIMAKRISINSRVSYSGLMNGQLSEQDEETAALTAVDLAKRPFYLLDNSSVTVADIETAALQIPDIKCIMVDYLGLVRASNGDKKLYEQVTEVSRDLKTLAMRLDIPVIAMCQLNREPKTGEKKPNLADLRDSGAIEQDADGVMLLYRQDYFDTEHKDIPKHLEVIFAKNRHGSSNFSLEFGWVGESGEVTDTEDAEEKTPWEDNNAD